MSVVNCLHHIFFIVTQIFREYTMREIATGNWGCGAFRGDPQLKALLQWMVASVVHSPCLHYYTFGDERMHEV